MSKAKTKMITEGVTLTPSPGQQLGDVIEMHINLRKRAQFSFPH